MPPPLAARLSPLAAARGPTFASNIEVFLKLSVQCLARTHDCPAILSAPRRLRGKDKERKRKKRLLYFPFMLRKYVFYVYSSTLYLFVFCASFYNSQPRLTLPLVLISLPAGERPGTDSFQANTPPALIAAASLRCSLFLPGTRVPPVSKRIRQKSLSLLLSLHSLPLLICSRPAFEEKEREKKQKTTSKILGQGACVSVTTFLFRFLSFFVRL